MESVIFYFLNMILQVDRTKQRCYDPHFFTMLLQDTYNNSCYSYDQVQN